MQRPSFLATGILPALLALALAASTGALLRFGILYGMPSWAQNYAAVRHAHSHLMYFGWVTLTLMAFIWSDLPRHTGRPLPRGVGWQMALTASVALLSYPAFWQNGYGTTQIGSANLPLGSIISTLNGLTWFLFAGLYVRATRGMANRPLPIQLWDWAIMLMLMASAGALGLVVMVVRELENPFLQQMFLHQFLDLFAVGWFNLALLGVVWSRLPAAAQGKGWLPSMSLALLLAPTFLLGMWPTLVPLHLFWLAAAANAGAALLMGMHLVRLWRVRAQLPPFSWLALASLAVTLLAAFAILIPGVWMFGGMGQLRIFYLHDLLLGWVSTMLFLLVGQVLGLGAMRAGTTIHWLWAGGVAVMLFALVGSGVAAFLPIAGAFWLQLAAWASIPVAVAALWLFAVAVLRIVHPAPLPLVQAQDGVS